MAFFVKPWLDQAGKFPITYVGGIPHFNQPFDSKAPRAGVLHTTEGGWEGSMAIFKRHYAPHFILGMDASQGKVRIAQLVQVGTIGGALRAHNNKAIVQIEMVGFSKETPWLPDDDTLEALASLMAVCWKEYGIPLEHPWKDGDWGKSGDNPHRQSKLYGQKAGWFGHGDCPKPDEHWDPGNLKWSAVFDLANKRAEDLAISAPMAMAGPASMGPPTPFERSRST